MSLERYKPKSPGRHHFKKGDPKPPGSGRKKGQHNQVAILMNTAWRKAAMVIGTPEPIVKKRRIKVKGVAVIQEVTIGYRTTGDGTEQDLIDYLVWLGLNHPTTFAQGLMRQIPKEIHVDGEIEHQHTVADRFKDVDLSTLSPEELQAAIKEALALTRPLPEKKRLGPPVLDNETGEEVEDEAA